VCGDPECLFCKSKSCKMCKMCLTKKRCVLRKCPKILSRNDLLSDLYPKCALLVSTCSNSEAEADKAFAELMIDDIGRDYAPSMAEWRPNLSGDGLAKSSSLSLNKNLAALSSESSSPNMAEDSPPSHSNPDHAEYGSA
jgi:hypothetical protein